MEQGRKKKSHLAFLKGIREIQLMNSRFFCFIHFGCLAFLVFHRSHSGHLLEELAKKGRIGEV